MRINEQTLKKEKQLMRKPYSSYTKGDIAFLEDQLIVNWVWAEWQWPIVRYILTKVFHFLDFTRHDVSFWKWWDEKDFHRANWGLLKYSAISLMDDYRSLHFNYKWSKIWRHPLFVITAAIKIVLIMYAYSVCDSNVWKKAFNFHK